MKFDFSPLVLDLRKKEIPVPPQHVEDIGEKLTLYGASYLALLNFDPQKQEDGPTKYKSYELAKKIEAKVDVELSVEEVALLKKKIGEFWNQTVMGSCWDMLEGKNG